MRAYYILAVAALACVSSFQSTVVLADPPNAVQVLTPQEQGDATALAVSLTSVIHRMPKGSGEAKIEANLAAGISQSGKPCKVVLASLKRLLSMHLRREAAAAVRALMPATTRCAVGKVGGIGGGPNQSYPLPYYSGGGGQGSDYQSR